MVQQGNKMKTKLFFFESETGFFNQEAVKVTLEKEGYLLAGRQMFTINIPPYENNGGFIFLGVKRDESINNVNNN